MKMVFFFSFLFWITKQEPEPMLDAVLLLRMQYTILHTTEFQHKIKRKRESRKNKKNSNILLSTGIWVWRKPKIKDKIEELVVLHHDDFRFLVFILLFVFCYLYFTACKDLSITFYFCFFFFATVSIRKSLD